MNMLSVIGLALVSAVLCILIKQYKPEYAMLVSLACGIIIFLAVLLNLTPAFDVMDNLIQKANINQQYMTILLKALGLCYVTQLACDTCNDAGQTSIASKVDLPGKTAVIVVSLPLFNALVDMALGLIAK